MTVIPLPERRPAGSPGTAGEVAHDACHVIRRIRFQNGINRDAQAVLMRLMADITRQQAGLIACTVAFDVRSGGWVEHSIWRAGTAPIGERVTAEAAAAEMIRLRVPGDG